MENTNGSQPASSAASTGSADYFWIRSALNAGGLLTVASRVPGKAIYAAQMQWPEETGVAGKISTSIDGALQNLDSELGRDETTKCENCDKATVRVVMTPDDVPLCKECAEALADDEQNAEMCREGGGERP